MNAEEKVWVTGTGVFSNGSRWLGGAPPEAGGDSSLVLRVRTIGTGSVTATNDLGNPFQLNQLLFEAPLVNVTIASAAGNSLEFAGSNPTIGFSGQGDSTISSPVRLNASAGPLKVEGAGYGNLTISGVISQGATPQSTMLIAASPHGVSQQIITLSGANTFSGGVTLSSGNLALAHASSLGSGALTVDGGTLRLNSALTVSNQIILNRDLVIVGPGGATLSGAISDGTGASGLVLRNGANTLTLTAASTYTGKTVIDNSVIPGNGVGGGTLRLTGGASILGSSQIEVGGGSTLRIDAISGAANRISDQAAVTLQSGHLLFSGVAGAELQTERIGTLASRGHSSVTLSPATGGGSMRLNIDSLARIDRGTFLLRLGGSQTIGTSLHTAGAPQGLVGGGGSGAQSSILPYVIADTNVAGNGSTFVTWSAATGLRALATSEYSELSGATATANVRPTVAATNNSPRTINSLVLAGSSISGTGTLSITSGAILGAGGAGVSAPIDFGAVEGNVFVGSSTFLSNVSGSNGLTKSGPGILSLHGSNTITGPLTINAGLISFISAANLGADSSSIVFAGPGAGLRFASETPVTLNRGVNLTTGIGSIDFGNLAGNLTISGPITGAGGLRISRTATMGEAALVLSGQSSYTGRTLLTGTADLVIHSDAALGAGGPLELSTSGRLILAGPWETERQVFLAGSGPGSPFSQIDTAGFDATLDGVLSGGAGLAKVGAGTLALRGRSNFSQPVTIHEGRVALSGAGSLLSNQWIVKQGANLSLDNRPEASSNRFARNAAVTLEGGELTVHGSASEDTREVLDKIAALGEGSLTILPEGSRSVTLQMVSLDVSGVASVSERVSGTSLLIEAQNLGGPAGSVFSRVIPTAVLRGPGPPNTFGFIPRVFAADPATGAATSFTIHDTSSDAAGVIGVRPLGEPEYSTGIIQNPANGGATGAAAHFRVSGGATAVGAANEVATLTMDAGGSITLAPEQRLLVAAGSILSRSGASGASITGGALDLGDFPATIYTAGELAIGSHLISRNLLTKLGPGSLTIGGVVHTAQKMEVFGGSVRLTNGARAEDLIEVNRDSTIETTGNVAIGAVTGTGSLNIGGGVMTLGTMDSNFAFAGAINGSGELKLQGGPAGNRIRTFLSQGTFTGDVTLESGKLMVTQVGGLGTGTLRIDGGLLYRPSSTGSPSQFSNRIVASTDIRFGGYHPVTLLPTAIVSTAHALEVRDRGGVIIESATEHTGETRSVFGFGEWINDELGAIRLRGSSGSIPASSAVRIAPTGALILDNSIAVINSPGGRVNDSAPVHLHSGGLEFIVHSNSPTQETVGPLWVAGHGTVTVESTQVAAGKIEAASLARTERGTVLFRSRTLGTNFWINQGSIMFTTPPALTGGGGTGPDTSIIPYAIGDSSLTGHGTGFVTYDPSAGIRLLNPATEYVQTLTGAASTQNVRLIGMHQNDAPVTINALMIGGGGSLSGPGSVRIESGLLLKQTGLNVEISVPLAFAATEANIIVARESSGGNGLLRLLGPVSGSGGLTKSGADTLILAAANPFTGRLTINSGMVEFSSMANLGADSSPIFVNGSAGNLRGLDIGELSGLRYAGGGALTFDRDIEVSGGFLDLATTGQLLTISSQITGTGGVHLITPSEIRMTGRNTYTGPTVVLRGALQLASSEPISATDRLILKTGTLVATSSFSIDRPLEAAAATIDTNGFDLEWNAPLVDGTPALPNRPAFTKTGAGALVLQDAAQYTGTFAVDAGTVVMNGTLAPGDSFRVGLNGTLAGTGSIGRTISIDGTVAPGHGVPGALTTGEAAFSNGSTLSLEIASPTSFDQLRVNGRVLLNGTVNLSLALQYDPMDNVDSFTIIDNDGADAIAGTGAARFAYEGITLDEGSQFSVGAQDFRISYAGGAGNDVVLYAVPEAGSASLLLAGGLLLFGRRRRLRGRALT